MTFQGDNVEPRLKAEDGGGDKGDYVNLKGDDVVVTVRGTCLPTCRCTGSDVWNWVKIALFLLFMGLLAGGFFVWVFPVFMDKAAVPAINWVTTTFTRPVLAIAVFTSVALFPTLLLPSSPSMWVAGITFGYGYGFLLIFPAVAVGESLPYFIGSLFNHKIQEWLDKYPKKASFLRSAGEGDWLYQFKAVTLIRISPFPYILYNYCSVTTNVKYGPYILGSLVGMVPDIFMGLYSGILIRTLADASHKQEPLSPSQIVITILGFSVAAGTTIMCTIYANKRLKALQIEDEPLLR